MLGISSLINSSDAFNMPRSAFMDLQARAKQILSRRSFSVGPIKKERRGEGGSATSPRFSRRVPDCYMHYKVHDCYGKPSVFIAIPKATFVRGVELESSQIVFEDREPPEGRPARLARAPEPGRRTALLASLHGCADDTWKTCTAVAD